MLRYIAYNIIAIICIAVSLASASFATIIPHYATYILYDEHKKQPLGNYSIRIAKNCTDDFLFSSSMDINAPIVGRLYLETAFKEAKNHTMLDYTHNIYLHNSPISRVKGTAYKKNNALHITHNDNGTVTTQLYHDDANFPMAHLHHMLQAFNNGESFYNTAIFDGTSSGLIAINTLILKPVTMPLGKYGQYAGYRVVFNETPQEQKADSEVTASFIASFSKGGIIDDINIAVANLKLFADLNHIELLNNNCK